MIQFTEKERESLRKKAAAWPASVDRLKRETAEVRLGELLIPKTGIGNWAMYYFCPECSCELVFDRDKPEEHKCPCCGSICQGEPYDSSWWGKINTQNCEAAYRMGILFLLTGDKAYGRKAAEIMTAYAACYPGYEVHGGIPYNGPGKANAQTLDEAVFLRNLAYSYDLVYDEMTEEERRLIRENLFLEGSRFLLDHRHRQIHNHEVIINSAIAIMGILLKDDGMVREGLYAPYGLYDQLEHGMQEDGIWFEGSLGYHYYALENFMAFEKFAVHTPYSGILHPNYKKMMEAPLDYAGEDGDFVLVNDMYPGHSGLKKQYGYEFAYRHFPSHRMTQIMNLIYKGQQRDNLEALIYGVDEIPKEEPVWQNVRGENGSGYTVLHGKAGRRLFFKHGTYGGEHDHYDRLGISFDSHKTPAIPDIGTTGYGAKLHYDYYKNTGTHNTVCIGEENQPPTAGYLTRFEEKEHVIYAEASADWTADYEMPDSYTIVQWNDEAYQNVRMRRKIAWACDYMVDLFLVEGAGKQSMDYTLHIRGERLEEETGGAEEAGMKAGRLSARKPLKYLHGGTVQHCPGLTRSIYQIRNGGPVLTIDSFCSRGTLIHAKGPDNPSVRDLEYLIWRENGDKGFFLNVIQTWKEGDDTDRIIRSACEVKNGKVVVTLYKTSGQENIEFELEGEWNDEC
ncbi:heparinase II/III family protein [Hungatella hathewayi]|uniref:heparinase II/III domain-containing protein n=1 Tax=Hungatella hathewayi TaxID=154046 RepID=UPI0003360059|nr:heparinase II/III family protein [Hungatella hathewayi]CCZ62967.1 heparinase II/III family protein [Hungatella hathewayi CAG:224]